MAPFSGMTKIQQAYLMLPQLLTPKELSDLIQVMDSSSHILYLCSQNLYHLEKKISLDFPESE